MRYDSDNKAGLVAGTLIHTQEGLRPINQIKVGDYVLSRPADGCDVGVYKRVVKTIECEPQETWFVSWEDPALLKKLNTEGLSKEAYFAAYGNGFVVTTPNHLFWVVDSDEERLKYEEFTLYIGPPYPRQQWVRADHLAPGMKLLLSNGRIVDVSHSIRVYKTNIHTTGWIPQHWRDWEGLEIYFANGQVIPSRPLHAHRFSATGSTYEGLVGNQNEAYVEDNPPGRAPESWHLSNAYNIKVEDSHTYFVDTMGVWVHDGNDQNGSAT